MDGLVGGKVSEYLVGGGVGPDPVLVVDDLAVPESGLAAVPPVLAAAAVTVLALLPVDLLARGGHGLGTRAGNYS